MRQYGWPQWALLAVALSLSACQTPKHTLREPTQTPAKQGKVSGHLLATPASERYPTESDLRYEQPTADPENPSPEYPADLLPQALPPVRVQVRVIVGAGGSVQAVQALNPDDSVLPEFLDAVRTAVATWFYQPLVRLRPNDQMTAITDDRGEEAWYPGTAEALPFHLDYEFVFRQAHGQGQVDQIQNAVSAAAPETH